MKTIFAVVGLAAAAVSAPASPITFESGSTQTHLLELYSSEGCSSCPPAEERMGALRQHPGLWKDFVPVAFHVDYWNNLGWPDRFSSPAFTQRQRDYAALSGGPVYTPEFILDGREADGRQELPKASANSKPGVLRVTIEGTAVVVEFQPAASPARSLLVQVAALGQGLVTDVRRGENAGRRLPHEFVALSLQSAKLERTPTGAYEAKLTLPEKTAAPISALAAWVTTEDDPRPRQATGGELTTSTTERLSLAH